MASEKTRSMSTLSQTPYDTSPLGFPAKLIYEQTAAELNQGSI